MATILIAYYTRTGNTQAMAEYIAQGAVSVGGQVTLKPVQDVDVDSLLEYDAIVLGSPTYYGLPASELKDLIDKSVRFHGQLAGKVGGAFASSANIGGGNETTALAILHAMLVHGMVVPGAATGDHYGPIGINSPDERVRNQCLAHGKRIAELAAKLFG